MTPPLLEAVDLCAGYGGAQVVRDLRLAVGAGEAVGLLGRNGMGKTTTVRAVFGQTPWRRGRISFDGGDISDLAPHCLARLGIGLVPEGRRVFPTLTVRENLVAFARWRPAGPPWSLERVFDLMPALAARAGTAGARLSGGEQQITAIGRALMTGPRMLFLDEATEGLAPTLRTEVWACLTRIKAEGVALIVIDKNLAELRRLTDRNVILEKGRAAWEGTSATLAADPAVASRLLGI